MKKLYRRGPAGMEYHEAWVHERTVVEHWGVVGDKGQTQEHELARSRKAAAAVDNILQNARARGFKELPLQAHRTLLVEYRIDGFGTETDLDKRHRLEDRMNQTLGWTGLGHCDGGSTGSNTMEVCCYVVDFAVAKSVVEKDLAGTEFGDFTRIFDEGE
jgi:predicted DNA-binding WGR domain protein